MPGCVSPLLTSEWLRQTQPFTDKETPLMLKFWVKTGNLLDRLRAERDGVASFEYVIVAVCIIGAVGTGFGSTTGGSITAALTTGIGSVTGAFITAVAGA
jgi:pilus assembly protein Flp/PilA